MLVVCALLALAGASVPARAHPASGRVRLAAVSPSPARTMYLADRNSNGLTGYVLRLDHGPARSYTLTLTDGATGAEDLDAYFYTDIRGTGTPCRVSSSQRHGVETGEIDCPGETQASWVVIVLARGANAAFTFTT